MIKVNEFVDMVKNRNFDEVTLETLINEANENESLEIYIQNTDDFVESFNTGNTSDLYQFAEIVRASDLHLNSDYVRSNIYNSDYTEADSITELLDDSDLQDIYYSWRDSLKDDTTEVKESDLVQA